MWQTTGTFKQDALARLVGVGGWGWGGCLPINAAVKRCLTNQSFAFAYDTLVPFTFFLFHLYLTVCQLSSWVSAGTGGFQLMSHLFFWRLQKLFHFKVALIRRETLVISQPHISKVRFFFFFFFMITSDKFSKCLITFHAQCVVYLAAKTNTQLSYKTVQSYPHLSKVNTCM